MNKITLFHGSDHIIKNPVRGVGDPYGDYGQAFYCTLTLDMAKEWANKSTKAGYANKYSFDGRNLKILDLTDPKYSVLNWIAILMHHRYLSVLQRRQYERRLNFLEENFYIDLRDYDVIIGYRADDAYFRFPMAYIQNELSSEKLEEIYRLGNLGKQIAILSEKAFSRIKYVSSVPAEPIFHERYQTRKADADARFERIRLEEINSLRPKLDDLIREYDQRK